MFSSMYTPTPRYTALILVDVQEDFCPPNGSLAVPDARSIIPTINTLLSYPFSLKLATKDHHPPDHISFASNHGPHSQPFRSRTTIINPNNPSERYETLLWPDHCVQGTPGNELLPELTLSELDGVVHKGSDPRVEMYSAFRSPLRDPPLESAVSGLGEMLREKKVTDVVMAGLAGDYCVKFSALDCVGEGFETYVVEEGVRSVAGEEGWKGTRKELEAASVRIVSAEWVLENLLTYRV